MLRETFIHAVNRRSDCVYLIKAYVSDNGKIYVHIIGTLPCHYAYVLLLNAARLQFILIAIMIWNCLGQRSLHIYFTFISIKIVHKKTPQISIYLRLKFYGRRTSQSQVKHAKLGVSVLLPLRPRARHLSSQTQSGWCRICHRNATRLPY